MDEKQEGQKTVVAFIAGLLIGGLLVWVFSSAPSSDEPALNTGGDKIGDSVTDTQGNSNTSGKDTSTSGSNNGADTTTATIEVNGEGSLSVVNQPAGMSVVLNDTTYPTTEGWVVVHEDMNGSVSPAILGAARYNTESGLLPKEVHLLKETLSGSVYHVVLHSQEGSLLFDHTLDVPFVQTNGSMIVATFTAQ